MLFIESKTILDLLLAVERHDKVVVVVGVLGSIVCPATLEWHLADQQKI